MKVPTIESYTKHGYVLNFCETPRELPRGILLKYYYSYLLI